MSVRHPKAFLPDDPTLVLDEKHNKRDYPAAGDIGSELELGEGLEAQVPQEPRRRRSGLPGWGSVLIGAVGSLASLAAGLWLVSFVEDVFARNDWVGWMAMVLLALAVLALFMIALKELYGLSRLRRIEQLHKQALTALDDNDQSQAKNIVRVLRNLFSNRKELAWGLARLNDHEADILDARERFTLAERELLVPLDAEAKRIIASSARRVSVVTVVSPAALVDVLFVAVENLGMLRRLAALYGGRPGMIGIIRLARMVVTHLAFTGGIALTSDFIQQLIGQKLTAKLSARLGEGIFNGALSARIGMAAIEICRPLPFIEARRPRFRDFFGELLRSPKKPDGEAQ